MHGIENIIQVHSVDAEFSWMSTPDAHTHPLVCAICTWSSHYVLSGSEPENNRSSWYMAWRNCDSFASVVWLCCWSGTLHQAICDDKAALFLLPFDMQQERNACHAMQQASLPVYSPQRPDMTITMQIHLPVLPDT